MTRTIRPAARLCGSLRLPGDKSISHRYAMLAAIAEGTTRIRNFSSGADCASTLGALAALGVRIERSGNEVVVHGQGLDGLRAAETALEAGNSGSTMRMLAGILAGQPFRTVIAGDDSLSRRPMDRIIRPLESMGARIRAREGRYPPLEIEGARLRPIEYELPVASAQVKSCVLFAGLYAEGVTAVVEPVRTRDHSEIALREFGAEVNVEGRRISVRGRPRLHACELEVPGDLSSAAFFLAATLLVPGSELLIEGVGLNPTRAALLDFLAAQGASLRVLRLEQRAGEPVGDALVRHSRLRGGVIEGALTAALIDEIPVLAVLGAASEEGLVVRDAAELRVKETDRIATVAENLRRMGIVVEVAPDGLRVPGGQRFRAARLDSFGDHRIAMAFAVAALAADGECAIEGAEAAAISFPEFFDLLEELAAGSAT
ncbi:MAG: 3-phosphoshikimate 1-carboxyvinyltransferase [Bryobacterales bacterium]|nr:3-phosphoshikimate 1-carboxyvinyltransferase [Bryobacteraceae bacterium]MDW8131256.1 3-phosphoshikimate 1-carboxyvinyltransferase [Bryobacterales bacterium]